MTQDLNTALLMLAIGMITVFIILSLVVASGHVIIRIVNRFSSFVPSKSSPARIRTKEKTSNSLRPAKVAAIIAAVSAVTNGQGRVVKIEPNKD
ncbi:MAG: OadG family protein [Saprospiraceae bacterium]|jgi:oxaloacetate decarboxylase gamma subunit|nr:OadG family protein [Saprospiraceae bacterium]